MKKLVCVFCSFFMGLGLIFADDGLVSGNKSSKSSNDQELNLVKQSKGVLIRVPVKNGVELKNMAQMRFVNTALEQNSNVDSAWNNGTATSYRPYVSEEEIATTEDNESVDQTCLFRRGCWFRPWRGVYYYSTPYYTPVAWTPTYYAPTYYSYSGVSYSYSYAYSWSTPYYRTYYYNGCCW